MTAASNALRKAADLIAAHGHAQGASERDGALCAVTALDRATANPSAFESAVVRLKQRLGIHADDPREGFRSLVGWNDAPGRTADAVIAALRDAAENPT